MSPTQIHYTWNHIVEETKTLANMIQKQIHPDIVLAIATGGWIPARLMKNFLPADYYSIGCKSYDDGGNMMDTITVFQTISPELVTGKTVLLLDDVCDSGRTLITTTELIKKNPDLVGLYTAVLHVKKKATITPDFFVRQFSDEWIVYPWELQ